MKYVKMLGLAAIAATALMAFVGASTASGTVLCKEPGTGSPTGTTCPVAKAYSAGTKFHAVNVGTVKFTTSSGDVVCNESTIEGSTNNEGSATETVTGSVLALTFAGCNCEVLVLKKGTFEIHWISGTHDGELTLSGFEITETCEVPFIGKIHCIYLTSNTNLGTTTGGNPATLDISSADIPRLATSGFCDSTGNLDATYQVTSPSPLYITGHT